MLKSKAHAEYLESFDGRSAHLKAFLLDLDHTLVYEVVALKDVYGPTASDPEISALVVSRESAAGGQASKPSVDRYEPLTVAHAPRSVDTIRAERGLPKLQTYVIDVVSGNHSLPTGESSENPPTLLDSAETSDRVKEMKLGSTYIRKWLAEKAQQGKGGTTRECTSICRLAGKAILLTARSAADHSPGCPD